MKTSPIIWFHFDDKNIIINDHLNRFPLDELMRDEVDFAERLNQIVNANMESFRLYNNNNIINNRFKEFAFHSPSASIKIVRVSLLMDKDSNIDRNKLISSLKLNAELRYDVYENKEVIDCRKEKIPIHLPFDPDQEQPVFILNQIIQSKKIKIGVSDKEHFYWDLIFELEFQEDMDDSWSLQFEYVMSEMLAWS